MSIKKFPHAPEHVEHDLKPLVLMKKVLYFLEGGENVLDSLLKIGNLPEHSGQMALVLLLSGYTELLKKLLNILKTFGQMVKFLDTPS